MKTQFLLMTMVMSLWACGEGGVDLPGDGQAPPESVGEVTPDGLGGSRPEDVGLIEFALETVPAEVGCLRVVGKGLHREKVVDVPVVPGAAVEHTLSGFPLGKVVFSAEAFAGACEGVTTRTSAVWVSDAIEASVIEGSKTKVTFIMQRNGRVEVAVNFPEEPACTAAGLACKSLTECCSRSCKSGLCQP